MENGVATRDMTQEHTYTTTITWTGNKGAGTVAYDTYARDYEIACDGKATISGSADPKYLGDARRHNPEELIVAALSSCHMLWYLHLCSANNIVVEAYEDVADGLMLTSSDGSGEFNKVTLRPRAIISDKSDATKAMRLKRCVCIQRPIRCVTSLVL